MGSRDMLYVADWRPRGVLPSRQHTPGVIYSRPGARPQKVLASRIA